MVKVVVARRYFDTELQRQMTVKEEIKVTAPRALKLVSLGLVDIIKLDKLSSKDYETIRGHKKG